MDLLHSWGVELAVHLQTRYSHYESWFCLASSVADLHFTFFCWFPIWFYLQKDAGLRLIWVAVIGDWLNLVLKWSSVHTRIRQYRVLFGERPYWWVHETLFYKPDPAPALKQFPITCETGPGSPSGHAMGAAGGWCVMMTALLTIAAEKQCPPLLFKLLHAALWVLMVLLELLVCLSRVYMAAHFPHQVIAGVFSGVLVAEVVSKATRIYSASMRTYFYTTLLLTSLAVGFYVLLKVLGVDLLWTLEKAQRWCVRPEWVHLDTTPFASLLRNMGTLFGLGLGLHSPLYTETRRTSAVFRTGCVTVSLLLLQLLNVWTFSSGNHMTFYFLSFTKSAAAALIPTVAVPVALRWISKGKRYNKTL